MTKKEMEHKWLGIWYGFWADLIDEWGFPELLDLQGREGLNQEELHRIIAFLDKLDKLGLVTGLMQVYTRVLSPAGKADLDDIQQIAGMLEKFQAPRAVEKLKTAIREFLRETNETHSL